MLQYVFFSAILVGEGYVRVGGYVGVWVGDGVWRERALVEPKFCARFFFTLKSFVNWSDLMKKRPVIYPNFEAQISNLKKIFKPIRKFSRLNSKYKNIFYMNLNCAKFQKNQRVFFVTFGIL